MKLVAISLPKVVPTGYYITMVRDALYRVLRNHPAHSSNGGIAARPTIYITYFDLLSGQVCGKRLSLAAWSFP
jgi:hypothetical protein